MAILWLLVIDELLHTLNRSGVTTIGYADDVAIVISGNFHCTGIELTKSALKTTIIGCSSKGRTINPSKTVMLDS